jgi:hypothetical protein
LIPSYYNHHNLTLTNSNAMRLRKIMAKILKKFKLKIPGGKMGTK